ncbi:uncharacterized protein LOC121760437 [Salvia splendens]|uniref:uncharacterized protein LOC121760437 n=1 Tax=Salvia splendens TaxID=180675 RepID=UPI001C27CCDD|nr:uncharacterized protein LOC121760437 [Salvia splendens]
MDNGQRQTLHLSSSMKNNVVQFLLKHNHDGVLARGAVMEAAETFSISRKTVYRLWKAAKEQMQRGEPAMIEGKVRGYHHVDRLELDKKKVRNLSTLERSSLRKMAVKLNVSKSTLGQWVKQVHIDEKWFYMTKVSDMYYLLPDEDEPYRSCKSKRYITKVMFMCVVSRPQFGMDGQATYDGKVGIFPFTEVLPA